MTSLSIDGASAGSSRGSLARPLLLILAVGQFASTFLSRIFTPDNLRSGPDVSPIVPPGPMFSIWGVILVASLAWAIAQVRPSTRRDPVRDRLAAPLLVTFAGFSLWLAVAANGTAFWPTLLVFLLLLVGLLGALRVAIARRGEIAAWSPAERVLLWFLLGVYTGWASTAIWINVATVVQGAGAQTSGVWGTAWQALVLLAASGTAVAITRWTGGLLPYALTAVYALVGAAIATSSAGFPVLTIVCAIGIVCIAVVTVVSRAQRDKVAGAT